MPASLPIRYADQRFVVLDKPAGVPVHAGPRGGESVEDWFPLLSRRRDGPWLVHRLDADTAGCLVVALRRAALLAAQAEFASGRAVRTYWAVVRGRPPLPDGCIDRPLVKRNAPVGWRVVPDPAGQHAVTGWRTLGESGDGFSWLELTPRTGRTHQLRVHCVTLGCPIVGDALYGRENGPLQLLARSIRLDLVPPVDATAPVPPHMRQALAACGLTPAGTIPGKPSSQARSAAADPANGAPRAAVARRPGAPG